MLRILSIDGGGIRGLVPARVLEELEKRAERPIAELFDLVAGTSTGAVIALALTCPGQSGKARFSATELAEFFRSDGRRIFHRSRLRAVLTVNGLLASKYRSRALERALNERFGNAMLSAALCDVIIATYDIRGRKPFFFKSANGSSTADLPMRTVALAAATPPAYLRPVRVRHDGHDRWLVDGGVVANNPALCAYAEVANRSSDILLVSIGCGSTCTDFAKPRIIAGGALAWTHPLFDIVLDGGEEATDHCLTKILHGDQYVRLQADLGTSAGRIDDTRSENLGELERSARALLKEHETELAWLATRLTPTFGHTSS